MKIHCFGDSFIEHPNVRLSDHQQCWQFILQRHFKDYEYGNYAEGGTGSIYSIQRFIEQIEKDGLKENDIVVFHLSYMGRDFDSKGTTDEQYRSWDQALREPYLNLINGATHVVENNCFFCSYLYHMCQIIKFKLILFAVDIWDSENTKKFPEESATYEGFKSRELFFNKMIELNDDLFHLSKINLFRESTREILSSQWYEWVKKRDAKNYQDRRINHLSKDNHKIMAEYIINVIEKKELPSFKNNYKTENDLYYKEFEVNDIEYVYD